MSNQTQPITIPESPKPRTIWFGFRINETEQTAIETLARRLNVTSSHMARHFLLQAISHISNNLESARTPTVIEVQKEGDNEHR